MSSIGWEAEPKGPEGPKRQNHRTRAVRAALATVVGAASVVVLPGLSAPAAARHRSVRCSETPFVAGSSLIRLGGIQLGTVRHFRSRRCQANLSQFVLAPSFQEWARQNGFQWFVSTVVFTRGQPVANHPFAVHPYQGYTFAYNPTELWSAPVFDDGGRCSSAVGSIVLYRGNQFYPINQAFTSVVCD